MYGCAVLITLPSSPSGPSRSDLHDHGAPGRCAYTDVTGQLAVQRFVPRIDVQDRRLQGGELLLAGEDGDPLRPETPQEPRAQLLVAPSEQRALSADHSEHEPHVPLL